MASFRKHNTKTLANAGVKLILKDAHGKDTEDWILVRGADSDAFQLAARKSRVATLDYLEKHGAEARKTEAYISFTVEENTRLQAHFVADWSFDEPCTVDNVVELFASAPGIAEQVDAFAGQRGKFVSDSPKS